MDNFYLMQQMVKTDIDLLYKKWNHEDNESRQFSQPFLGKIK